MDLRLAVTGFGNVGQGLASLLVKRGREYEQRYGLRLLLTGVTDRRGGTADPAGLDPDAVLRAKRVRGSIVGHERGVEGLAGAAFLDAAGADILIEAASTNFEDAEPGWSYIREAIDREMDVVLASKGSLALHWQELFDRARGAGRSVLFSATVGAPVPSLQMADRVLVGTTVHNFDGILNGTTHQILTSMSEGATYAEGVRRAQEMGIAETDPTLDVDGWDAAAKVAIVANVVFGSALGLRDVRREGIRGVTPDDLAAAHDAGDTIKLIASARREGDSVRLMVRPQRVPRDHPLGRLRRDAMGIVFATDPLGTMSVTCEPAGHTGGIVTAMACLRDVFNLARDRGWLRG